LAYAYDLAPELIAKIESCTFAFRFPPDLVAAFRGPDRFVSLNYKRDYAPVRRVADVSGDAFTRAAFDKRKAREQASKK
jgi:phosphonate transport system substrate-binding protein